MAATIPALLLLMSLYLTPAVSERVVFFPAPHTGIAKASTNVAHSLTSWGHEVYVCLPEVMVTSQRFDLRGLKVIPYKLINKTAEDAFGMLTKLFWARENMAPQVLKIIPVSFHEIMKEILKDKHFLKTVKELNADMFVITNHPFFRAIHIVPYSLDKPFVFLGPLLFNNYLLRVPFIPALLPAPLNGIFQQREMTFWHRVQNTLFHIGLFKTIMSFSMDEYYDLTKDVLPNKARICYPDLVLKSEMFLMETDHILDHPRPILPNTQMVGGTAATPARELQEPFKSFMNGAQNGVVLVTFGSAIVHIPDQTVLDNMISAFMKLNQRVVWRVNITSPLPERILTSEWVPQNDILAHKNTKLFVSHCGANGQYESLYHGVPMLCLPLFGDQPYNAQRVVDKKLGLKGHILEMTGKDFLYLLKETLENPVYQKNIQKASALYRELYKDPANQAAYWIDHVTQYGGSYMRWAGHDVGWLQFFMLDILAVVVLGFALFIGVVCVICRCLCRCCGRKGKTKIA